MMDMRDFLLGELRCAALHARLAAAEIDSIGIALRGGIIATDAALEWLLEVRVLPLIGFHIDDSGEPAE
jgi:hypothetical protein